MITAGKVNFIETMRFIVSTKFAHISFFQGFFYAYCL